MMVTGNV